MSSTRVASVFAFLFLSSSVDAQFVQPCGSCPAGYVDTGLPQYWWACASDNGCVTPCTDEHCQCSCQAPTRYPTKAPTAAPTSAITCWMAVDGGINFVYYNNEDITSQVFGLESLWSDVRGITFNMVPGAFFVIGLTDVGDSHTDNSHSSFSIMCDLRNPPPTDQLQCNAGPHSVSDLQFWECYGSSCDQLHRFGSGAGWTSNYFTTDIWNAFDLAGYKNFFKVWPSNTTLGGYIRFVPVSMPAITCWMAVDGGINFVYYNNEDITSQVFGLESLWSDVRGITFNMVPGAFFVIGLTDVGDSHTDNSHSSFSIMCDLRNPPPMDQLQCNAGPHSVSDLQFWECYGSSCDQLHRFGSGAGWTSDYFTTDMWNAFDLAGYKNFFKVWPSNTTLGGYIRFVPVSKAPTRPPPDAPAEAITCWMAVDGGINFVYYNNVDITSQVFGLESLWSDVRGITFNMVPGAFFVIGLTDVGDSHTDNSHSSFSIMCDLRNPPPKDQLQCNLGPHSVSDLQFWECYGSRCDQLHRLGSGAGWTSNYFTTDIWNAFDLAGYKNFFKVWPSNTTLGGYIRFVPVSMAASCAGFCGVSSRDCWCDSVCAAYGDCCADYTSRCEAHTPAPTEVAAIALSILGGVCGCCCVFWTCFIRKWRRTPVKGTLKTDESVVGVKEITWEVKDNRESGILPTGILSQLHRTFGKKSDEAPAARSPRGGKDGKRHIIWNVTEKTLEKFTMAEEVKNDNDVRDEVVINAIEEEMPQPRTCIPIYNDLDRVEYFSESHSIWLLGTIEVVVSPDQSVVYYNVVLTTKQQIRWNVPLHLIRRPLKHLAPVCVFDPKRYCWKHAFISPATIPDQTLHGYRIHYVLPQEDDLDIPEIERAPATMTVLRFPPDSNVDVYNGHQVGWRPAIVLNFIEETPPPPPMPVDKKEKTNVAPQPPRKGFFESGRRPTYLNGDPIGLWCKAVVRYTDDWTEEQVDTWLLRWQVPRMQEPFERIVDI